MGKVLWSLVGGHFSRGHGPDFARSISVYKRYGTCIYFRGGGKSRWGCFLVDFVLTRDGIPVTG